MDQILQTQFFYENGLDMEIKIASFKQQQQSYDDNTRICLICNTFGAKLCRCQSCGRLLCAECYPQNNSNCIMCYTALKIEQLQQSPQLYEIRSLFANNKLYSQWGNDNIRLRCDFFRMVQNLLRNDLCRKDFINGWGQQQEKGFKTKIPFLNRLLESVNKYTDPIYETILSIYINLTASTNPEFALLLDQNGTTMVLMTQIDQLTTSTPTDQSAETKQKRPALLQLALHALRNITVTNEACDHAVQYTKVNVPAFYSTMFMILQTGSLRVQEFVVAIFGNLLQQDLNAFQQQGPIQHLGNVLPKNAIAGICRKSQLVITCNQLMCERLATVQIMAIRAVSLLFRFESTIQAAADSEFLANLVKRLSDDERVATVAAFSLFTSLIELGKQFCTLPEYQKKYTEMLFRPEMLKILIQATQSENAIVARSSVAVIHALAEINGPKLVDVIADKAKPLTKDFEKACKNSMEHEQYEDITKHLDKVIEIIKSTEIPAGESKECVIGALGYLAK